MAKTAAVDPTKRVRQYLVVNKIGDTIVGVVNRINAAHPGAKDTANRLAVEWARQPVFFNQHVSVIEH